MDNKLLIEKGILKPLFKLDKFFSLLLLAVFIFNACWIADSLALYFTARPVMLLWHVIFLAVTCLAGIAVLIMYLVKSGHIPKRNTQAAEKQALRNTFSSIVFSTVMLILFVSGAAILLNLWSQALIPRMAMPGKLNDLAGAGIYLLLAFFLNCVFLFIVKTCCIYITQGIKLSRLGKATLYSFQDISKQGKTFILYAVFLFALFIIFYSVNNLAINVLNSVIPGIFLAKFLLYVIISFLRALLVMIVLRMGMKLGEEITDFQEAKKPACISGSKKIPVFAVFILLLTVVAVRAALPGSLNAMDLLLTNIEYRITLTDVMMQEDHSREAVVELSKAEADLDAVQKYLQIILKNRGEDIDASDFGILSKHLYPACGYDDYFNVLLAVNGVQDEYDRGKLVDDIGTIPESALWAYGYYQEQGLTEEALRMFNAAVMQGVFVDRNLAVFHYSDKNLYRLLERTEELEEELNRRKLYEFMERAQYEDRITLCQEVQEFILEKGGNSELYAWAATLAYETALGDTEYEWMKEDALKYFELAEFQDNQELVYGVRFVTYMLYRSFCNKEAVEFAGERYREYPQNADIALIYANALLEDRKHKESNDVLALMNEDRPYKDYLMAINYLEQDEWQKSIQSAHELEKTLAMCQDDEEMLKQLDFYFYGYILECVNYLERDGQGSDSLIFGDKAAGFVREAEKQQDNSLVFCNIIGLKNWFRQQYDESNQLFERVLQEYPALSYPYLMIGVNYLEKKEVEGVDYSQQAESYLLKYIERRPEAEEAYFCLGHIYKHRGETEKAKRAFQKVLDITPFHNYDYDVWGITYHSQDSILNLGGGR